MLRRTMIAIQQPCAVYRQASPGRSGFVHWFLCPPLESAKRSDSDVSRATFNSGGRALELNLVPRGLNATIQKSRPSTAFGEKVKALSSRPTTLVAISMFEMLLPTLTAIAQTTTATVNASSAGGSEMAEIVVTARKTSERLQDIPMSLAVVTAQTIEKTGAITVEDLGREVPGLTVVSAAPGQNVITLRGLSGNNTVGFYLDDTPLSIGIGNAVQPTNFDMDPVLFDLDRVEVLRGPQGTLYGASSFGGTVRYITNQPNLTETHATAKTTFSDTDGGGFNQEVDGLVNLPLIPGYIGVRAMAFERDYDGYIDRYPTDRHNYLAVLPGPVARDINTEKTYGGRVAIEAKPTDSFSATLSTFYQRMDLGAPFTFDDPPGTFDDPIQSRLVSEPSTDRVALYTLTLQGDVQAVHVTSSTSYLDRLVANTEDDSKVLNFFFPLAEVYPSSLYSEAGNHDFVEELRATGNAGPVHALVGLFYAHAVSFGTLNWPTPPQYLSYFDGEDVYFNWNDFLDVQKATFGELNIDLAPGLQATLGDRLYQQSQRYTVYINGIFNGGVVTPTSSHTSEARGTTPKYGLSYHVTPDILAYTAVAKGYREGGPLYPFPSTCAADLAALGLATPPTAYKPDSIWNYELGAKTEWLDHRLTMNGAVYYIDWTNIQQNITLPTCGFGFVGNFGKASSKGTEFEMNYDPTRALKLSLSLAYNEAKLTSTIPGAAGEAGQTLEYAPRWMGATSAEYTRQLAANTSGYFRVDFNTSTHENANYDAQSIYYNVAGYSLLNLRIGVKQDSWQGGVFISNALDKHAETELPLANGVDLPTQRRIALNRPRTIGLDIRFNH
jgi:iron complex outermembrane receptor protein